MQKLKAQGLAAFVFFEPKNKKEAFPQRRT